jgi:phage tail tape-measure protein
VCVCISVEYAICGTIRTIRIVTAMVSISSPSIYLRPCSGSFAHTSFARGWSRDGRRILSSRTVQRECNVLDVLGRSPAAATNQARASRAELQSGLADRLAGFIACPHVLLGHVRLAGVGVAQQRQLSEAAHVLQRL